MTSIQQVDTQEPAGAAIESDDKVQVNPGAARSRYIPIWLAGIFLICFLYFIPFPLGPNENAHMDLTLQIVDHATFTIDSLHSNTVDLAFHRGHYYINKAPGQSMLGVPIYLLFKAMFHSVTVPPTGVISRHFTSYILLTYLLSIFTVSIPAVLLLMLFYWFLGFFTPSSLNRAILTFALGLGTMMFRYEGTIYSHVPEAALLFTAFVLIWMYDREDAVRGRSSDWLVHHPNVLVGLAGLCLGLSVPVEYSGVAITGLIGLYALIRLPS